MLWRSEFVTYKSIKVSTSCMTRKCLGCGKAGHRLESCTSKAAFEIRGLRAKVEKTRHKPGSRNNPGRQNRKKAWSKEKARKAYTKQSVRKTFLKKRQQDCRAGWSGFAEEHRWPDVGVPEVEGCRFSAWASSMFGLRMELLGTSSWECSFWCT